MRGRRRARRRRAPGRHRAGRVAPAPGLPLGLALIPPLILALILPLGLALGLPLVLPRAALAQIHVVEGDGFGLDLSGYVRSLTAVHEASWDVPGQDRTSAFNGEVLRLRWNARWGDALALEVHDRIQARVSTQPASLGESVAGFGVSVVPGRAVDLESPLVRDDEGRLDVRHDVDRLAVTVYTDAADVTLGRQAITWGVATLFPVADLWSRFSPFELDTEEKPGIDAARVLAYPGEGLELDVVAAARGRTEDWSAGARLTATLPSGDLYGAVGKFWDEVVAMAGATWLGDRNRLRLEAAVPWDLEADELDLPRVTLGWDRPGVRWSVGAEYHFNGIGATEPEAYVEVLQGERFARGESYFLGRHYLGGLATWTADDEERLRLTGTALVNLGDGSASLTPLAVYDLGQSARVSLGALVTLGEVPDTSQPIPILRSEYGAYGDLWFTRLSVYF